MNIEKLSLAKILNQYNVREQEFEYAGIQGTAEIFGWQIVFYRKGSEHKTVAMNFQEISSNELVNIANIVLRYINDIGVLFGDNYDKIKKIYGTPYSFDDDIENTIRYNYLISPDFFVSFGLTNDKLTYLEIIKDNDIVTEVLNVR